MARAVSKSAEIKTSSGRRAVAVKVLRPGIERRFKVDLAAFGFVARSAELLSAEGKTEEARSLLEQALPLTKPDDMRVKDALAKLGKERPTH